jgi:hypothetical protein
MIGGVPRYGDPPVFTKRLENLRIHPSFGPDEKKAPRVLHATQVV